MCEKELSTSDTSTSNSATTNTANTAAHPRTPVTMEESAWDNMPVAEWLKHVINEVNEQYQTLPEWKKVPIDSGSDESCIMEPKDE